MSVYDYTKKMISAVFNSSIGCRCQQKKNKKKKNKKYKNKKNKKYKKNKTKNNSFETESPSCYGNK